MPGVKADALTGAFGMGLFQHPKPQQRLPGIVRCMKSGKFSIRQNLFCQGKGNRPILLFCVDAYGVIGQHAKAWREVWVMEKCQGPWAK